MMSSRNLKSLDDSCVFEISHQVSLIKIWPGGHSYPTDSINYTITRGRIEGSRSLFPFFYYLLLNLFLDIGSSTELSSRPKKVLRLQLVHYKIMTQ